jgi:4'-phosphopantetheinyl transferase
MMMLNSVVLAELSRCSIMRHGGGSMTCFRRAPGSHRRARYERARGLCGSHARMIHTNKALTQVQSYNVLAPNANSSSAENAWEKRKAIVRDLEMKSPTEWSSPLATPDLARREIHVWCASLATDEATLQRFESTLADQERERAGRFIFARDSDRYIAARGILRDLLGKYLRCAPQSIEFAYGPYGKPAVANAALRPAICFNLSHSHGLAVVAIGHEREVGIDVELIRAEFASEAIAKRYFSAKEIDELSRLPAELRTEGFFLCWTRKEAYIKAKGDGLRIPLDSFDVSLSPGGRATLSSVDAPRWGIESFVPELVSERRFAAAVVAEGKDWRTRYFEWKQPNGEEQLEE